jgi:ATP-binding cassette subfamily B protein
MRQKWKMLQGFMQGQRLRYGGAILVMLVGTLLSYGVPLVSRTTIDYVISGKPLQAPWYVVRAIEQVGGRSVLGRNLWLATVCIAALSAGAGVFGYLRGRWAATAAEATARRMRDRLYDHLQHLPCRYHDKAETGDLVQRCTSDVDTVRGFLSGQIVEIARAVIMLMAVLPIMLWLSGRMTLIALSMVPLICVFSAIFFAKIKYAFKLTDEAEGAMTTVLQENLTGIRVVRAFARQDFECEKFGVRNAAYRDRTQNLIRLMAWYWSSTDFLCHVQNGLVLVVGGLWTMNGRITVGTLFAFLAYVNMLLWPIRQMGRILTDLGKAMVSLQRIHEILQQPAETVAAAATVTATGFAEGASADAKVAADGDGRVTVQQATEPEVPMGGRSAGHISVEDLAFAYDEKPVLSGISFEVQPGQTLAILGPSGSGKSTLMHLLMRLYDYTQGSIAIDGREIRSADRKHLRSQIGSVMQEPFLYSKSLRENVRMGVPDAQDDEITEAAEMACIHDSIRQFEKGYDTLVGERGVTLSGGQQQRVALARAILKDPPILILDDALSAVDTRTEALILEALRRRRGRHTTLVIAHRLSTLAQADRILVLERGRVVQSGTHASLLREEGLYQRLWRIQSSLEEDLGKEVASNGWPVTTSTES